MAKNFTKRENRIRRHVKVRAKIQGTADIPRLSIFKSNKGIFVQVINDEKGETLVSLSSVASKKKNNVNTAKETGLEIAKLIQKVGIKKIVFDRGGYIYTGKVKAFADAVREGGVNF